MPDGTARSTPISSTSAALQVLARHASVRATGELIAIGESVEVHLYLVAGRVAWGTTTADRFAFRKHLTNVLQIGETELQEALAEGRRTRRPLGETLVAWGVLTAVQLREGLKAQVLSALASLASCNAAQSLFLPRGPNYVCYEASLTFALDELLPQQTSRDAVSAALERLQAAVPELTWAGALAGGEVVASVKGPAPAAALKLERRLTAGTELLGVRASGGNLVAGTLPGESSVWCALPADVPITTALGTLCNFAERPRPAATLVERGRFEAFGESGHRTSGVREILEIAQDPVGLVVLERGGSPDLWALARAPLQPGQLAELAAQRQRVLDADVYATRGAPGIAFQSALVADSRWCWFGADLVSGDPASLWLVLPRAASPGLGWALLATLARHLSALEAADFLDD